MSCQVEFVDGVLFIPFFFVCMGLLNRPVFMESLTTNLAFTLTLAASFSQVFGRLRDQALFRLSVGASFHHVVAALVGLQQGTRASIGHL